MQADGSDVSNQARWPGEFESFFQNVNPQQVQGHWPEVALDPASDRPEPGEFTRFFKPDSAASLPPDSPPPALDAPKSGEFISPVESSEPAPPAMQQPVDDAAPVMPSMAVDNEPFDTAPPARTNWKWLIVLAILVLLFGLGAMFLVKK